ncbi:MAG: DNA-binding response regulator [Nitrospirota bacterium]|nr:DNA-binding response regulator [Nitrospirota bacterium]MDH5768736.1 DNA-binding response regulator [Nitrospirota bacterium]
MAKKSILVIDDCQVTREVLWTILKDNFRVYFAETAWVGLRMISENISLVFLDLILPDLSGLEVLRQIRKRYPSTPVVIITGFGTESACQSAFRIGANDYMKKPFTAEEILQKTELLIYCSPHRQYNPISLSIDDRYADIPSDILDRIMKVKNYIDENLKLSLTISDAFKMAGMNRTYFCKYFKLLTGQSFQDYLNTIRFKRARALLRSRSLKVSDIAELLGYKQKYFSEAFKRTFGIPPKKLKS